MLLAKAVIDYAQSIGATPMFFVSETVGADDPFTAKEKLAIYKKVFTQYKSIFHSAKTVNVVAQTLNDQGYTSMTLVVGEDQKNDFSIFSQTDQVNRSIARAVR